MKYVREHKTLSMIVLIIMVLFLTTTAVYGRYIKNILNNFILETKAFYFNSSVLNINGKNYSITNWDGVNSYTLTIDLNNYKSEERYTKTDISYQTFVDCPDTVVCVLSKEQGIIHPEDSTDSYLIVITPKQNFHEGDSVTIRTHVTSTAPYEKSMSASYTIGVERSNFSYSIEDSVSSKYLMIHFTNSVSYYVVSEAFDGYAVGDYIGLDDYNQLSSVNQAKCFSAIVVVEYDPRILMVDMTNDLFLHRLNTDYQEQTINGFQYVSKFSFKVNASSSSSILFYKDDITKNYTYPVVNANSIIRVSTRIAS